MSLLFPICCGLCVAWWWLSFYICVEENHPQKSTAKNEASSPKKGVLTATFFFLLLVYVCALFMLSFAIKPGKVKSNKILFRVLYVTLCV